MTHHPDARFWIPTIDEYTKAGYYDPDRYGPGQGGYWLHPGGSDDPLVAGPPGVGQAAGNWAPPGSGIAVGSYPDTQSPWGLWDLSSTDQQHTEGYIHPSTGTRRLRQGSRTGSLGYVTDDRLDTVLTALPGLSLGGVRLATPVPSPASLSLLLGVVLVHKRDRRHRYAGSPNPTPAPREEFTPPRRTPASRPAPA